MTQNADNPIKPQGKMTRSQRETRKPYRRPAILHELQLETRAGSPLGIPDPLDPFGLNPDR